MRRIRGFKEQYPEYSDIQVNDMRQALILSGDIRKIYGNTQSARYKITDYGRVKLNDS